MAALISLASLFVSTGAAPGAGAAGARPEPGVGAACAFGGRSLKSGGFWRRSSSCML